MTKPCGLPSEFRVVDTTARVMTGDVLFPFAYEEAECRKVGQGALPLIHLWRHQQAFVLGLRDRKLPYAPEAMKRLEQRGYAVTVRSSGGAAVPLDSGVVNISIILPKPQGTIDFRNDFQTMVEIIQTSLNRFTQDVNTGEIFGSYCPGDYDLSIHGKKFCGIAQRRQTQAFIVQAFVVVEGSGESRARLVRSFYRMASTGSEHPEIRNSSMASLADLLHLSSAEAFIASFKEVLSTSDAQIKYNYDYDPLMLFETEQIISDLRHRFDQ